MSFNYNMNPPPAPRWRLQWPLRVAGRQQRADDLVVRQHVHQRGSFQRVLPAGSQRATGREQQLRADAHVGSFRSGLRWPGRWRRWWLQCARGLQRLRAKLRLRGQQPLHLRSVLDSLLRTQLRRRGTGLSHRFRLRPGHQRRWQHQRNGVRAPARPVHHRGPGCRDAAGRCGSGDGSARSLRLLRPELGLRWQQPLRRRSGGQRLLRHGLLPGRGHLWGRVHLPGGDGHQFGRHRLCLRATGRPLLPAQHALRNLHLQRGLRRCEPLHSLRRRKLLRHGLLRCRSARLPGRYLLCIGDERRGTDGLAVRAAGG